MESTNVSAESIDFFDQQFNITLSIFSFFIFKVSDNIYFTGFSDEWTEIADLRAYGRIFNKF